MKNKKITLILLSIIFFSSCNKNIKNSEKIKTDASENKKTEREEWMKKAKIILEIKEGDTLETIDPIFTKSKNKTMSDDNYLIDLGDYETNFKDENFEYSDYWKKEAFKATKGFILNEINKNPNCKVIRQGYYNSTNIRYIGNRAYSVKLYCEFNCNQGYDNPSFFFVEISYQGNNYWRGRLIKQKFVN